MQPSKAASDLGAHFIAMFILFAYVGEMVYISIHKVNGLTGVGYSIQTLYRGLTYDWRVSTVLDFICSYIQFIKELRHFGNIVGLINSLWAW